ncbi:MAG TPA: hypothetical protein IAA29_00685 [Candidatus Paenibacillus intestinavium]|nr:hypothetical protein [Candidatus Paenibacillus intestinavium]
MNELTREQILSMPDWIEYQENDRSIESHVKHLITADGDVWLGQRYRTNYGSRHYAWHVLIRDEWQEINGITHWSPITLPREVEHGQG